MQERHARDLREYVMLGLAFQTSWDMENLHHKSCILPDPDIFTFDMEDLLLIQPHPLHFLLVNDLRGTGRNFIICWINSG